MMNLSRQDEITAVGASLARQPLTGGATGSSVLIPADRWCEGALTLTGKSPDSAFATFRQNASG